MSYEPKKIEEKWQKIWEEKLNFPAEDFSKKKKFYALVEFPYPSGAGLHTGHAFSYTLLDIFARKKRMDGFNVLYPMGWDAFGLPTENYAIKTGVQPAEATKSNTDNFRRQMKSLGYAFNWDREINTTDPKYYKWTQWIFAQFFKNGLAYKEEMEINWCPSCKIGLANEEVVGGKCERCGAEAGKKKLSQWLLKITAYADRLAEELDLVDYSESIVAAQRNWIGRSEGVEINFSLEGKDKTIQIFTTRPDTLFGATFFVLAPEHPLALEIVSSEKQLELKKYIQASKEKKEFERIDENKEKTGVFISAYVLNPLSKEKIPVYVADFVVMGYGTGAIMGVPGHDPRDWKFAKKQGIEIREVISGGKAKEEPYLGLGELVNSGEYTGLDSETAKEKIFTALEKKGLAKKTTQYHLRDWIFSRQHYWGEPIPMIFCKACAEKGISYWETKEAKNEKRKSKKFEITEEFKKKLAGWFPVPEKELPLELPKMERYEPTGTGKSPLASVRDWQETKCPHCAGPGERETDTMPNWAGSSWYYLRYIDPKNNDCLADKEKLDYWLPVDFYLGGAEHTTLHLLYSRFWHKFLNDLGLIKGKEPYAKRRHHGLILGEDGHKMSKSHGNIINPDEAMERVGADTLRAYLVFMGPYNNTLPWSTASMQGVRRFLERFYNFMTGQIEKKTKKSEREIQVLVNRLIKEVGEDIDDFKYNTAIAKMMKFLNEGEESEIGLEELKKLLLVFAPFIPHLAEELWEKMGGKFSIHQQSWPRYDAGLVKEEKITFVVQINGKVRERLEVEAGLNESEAKELVLASEKIKQWLEGKQPRKVIFVRDKLINFVI